MGINVESLEKKENVIEVQSNTKELQVVEEQSIDIVEETNKLRKELRNSREVEMLTSQIDVSNPDTVLAFGIKASEGISKVSDQLLTTMRLNKNEDNSELLNTLSKLMNQFNIDDFAKTKEPGFLEKIFKKINSSLEAMFKKYDTLGSEVEKIYIELKKYENEIKDSNKGLNKLFEENLNFYNELQKYIVATDLALEEMDRDILPQYKQKSEQSGNQMDVINYQELLRVRDMIEQRGYDLRVAENIAIQTVPMLQGMKHNNLGLVRKINSAFVITLPVFKQCLAQAVLIKKQELQAKSLKALDETTNELLIRNSQNIASTNSTIARMAGKSSIDIQTLERMHHTIKQGIEETLRIEEANRVARREDIKRLEEINNSTIQNVDVK